MAQHYELLSDLVYGTNWTCIKVRVGRLWTLINRTTKQPYTISMQLLDSEGNQKQAIVPKNLLEKYEDIFQEGKIYEIRVFNVYDSNVEYRAIPEDWTIHIRRDTSVTTVNEDDEIIPRYKFNFVTDDIIPKRVDMKDQLTDIWGIIRGISNIIPVTTRSGIQTTKSDVQVETGSGKSIIASLWAEKTTAIDGSMLDGNDKPLPIVITSTTVSVFSGKFTFASTHATKVYVDIQIPEINEAVQRSIQCRPGSITLMSNSTTTPSQSNIQTLETTLADMMNDIWNSNIRDKKYVVDATIMKLSNTVAWSYLSCPFDKSNVRPKGDIYCCTKCSTEIENPITRFRVTIELFDATRAIKAIVFDKEAETLIGRNVHDLLAINNMENGARRVDKIFDNLVGSDAIFEFKPSNYDVINKGKSVTISRITKLRRQSQTSFDLSQISDSKPPSEQSATKEDTSPTEYQTLSFDNKSETWKGKNILIQDDERSIQKDGQKVMMHNSGSEAKKTAKRGIIINEPDDNASESAQIKKRKKDV